MARPRQPTKRPRKPPPPSLADRAWPWIVRAAGLGLLAFETVVEQVDRPMLLVIAAAMIGLPELVRWDRNKE